MGTLRLNGAIVDYSNDGWVEFKKWLDGTYASLRYVWVDEGEAYNIAALDDQVYRTCGINKPDAADFEANYKKNVPLASQTADGKQVVSMWPTEGTRKTFITPSWSDKTTWLQQAVRVVDEQAAQVDDTHYTVAHTDVIDTYHGKTSGEEFAKDAGGNSYRVAVKVNGIIMVERDPAITGSGSFMVDYTAGALTFFVALDPGSVVLVTYHYATTSTFTIKPAAGKILKVKSAEAQFSADIGITDSIRFQPYGYVQVFAPQLWQGNGGPYPTDTLIPLGDATVYKTMMDYINEANGAYPEIVALGGSTWRGSPQSVMTFPWNYIALTDLFSAYGMEIRISLEHEIPFTGTVATATFYCLSVSQ